MDRSISSPEFRATYIGGSDAAPIIGVGLWASPYSVWESKVGDVPPVDVSERMQWGTLLEGPVAVEWARREGVKNLRKSRFRRHPTIPYIGGHPDFEGIHPADGRIIIETKLSDRAGQWEAEDGDDIPLQYFLQVQHYLLVTGVEVAYLVVLIRGQELRSWRIPADADVQSGMLDTYADFWRLVETKTPPEVDGHEATAEALRRRYPTHDETEMVADLPEIGLLDDLLSARRLKAEAESIETIARNRLMERMGTASKLLAPNVVVTWRQNKPSVKTDWESVAKAYRSLLDHAARADDWVDLDAIESIHTNTMPGARPFRVTLKSED